MWFNAGFAERRDDRLPRTRVKLAETFSGQTVRVEATDDDRWGRIVGRVFVARTKLGRSRGPEGMFAPTAVSALLEMIGRRLVHEKGPRMAGREDQPAHEKRCFSAPHLRRTHASNRTASFRNLAQTFFGTLWSGPKNGILIASPFRGKLPSRL